MLDQSDPDSGLDHWKWYRGVELEKNVETESQVNSKILYVSDTFSWYII
jgi:hypothetical protein